MNNQTDDLTYLAGQALKPLIEASYDPYSPNSLYIQSKIAQQAVAIARAVIAEIHTHPKDGDGDGDGETNGY